MPWHSVADDAAQVAGMELELARELSAEHELYGLPVRTLARRQDCDDVLFAIEDGTGRVAVSSISRAYYAAYCAVAHRMVEQSVKFPQGWDNPAHDQVARWIAGNRSWPAQDRRRLAQAMQRLRKAREDADYRPRISLAKSDVIRSLNEAGVIFRLLG